MGSYIYDFLKPQNTVFSMLQGLLKIEIFSKCDILNVTDFTF